jgi:uncharacterized protein involved in outer membrane biogenesis
VQQEIHRLLGKDVAFDRLEASIWGGLGFSAKEFQITDDRRFAATPFLHANELRLGISLWQLLHGRLVIDSLSLNTPEVQIITNEEGAVNVSAFAQRKKALSLFPRIPPANSRHPGVEFAIDAIHACGLIGSCTRYTIASPGRACAVGWTERCGRGIGSVGWN